MDSCVIILFVWNLIVMAAYVWDKYKAAHNFKNRTPEKSLLLMALMFGGYGAFLGMYIFRHKTKHLKFKILVPLFAIIQTILIGYVYYENLLNSF